jgi:hypothetical protein
VQRFGALREPKSVAPPGETAVNIEQILFDVSEALQMPVLILALVVLA